MSILREYIRSTLENKILIPPPPSIEFRKLELSKISNQRKNRVTPIDLAEALDSDMAGLFNSVIMSLGMPCHLKNITSFQASCEPSIVFHKKFFNTSRPYQLASIYNIDFDFDDLESARTPSYPSGHTTQAFFIAHKLASLYPDYSGAFYDLADMIADSRIDAGVHFPSDNIAGKKLALKLFDLSNEVNQ